MATKRTRGGKTFYEASIYTGLEVDGKRERLWLTAPTMKELARLKQEAIDERDGKPRDEDPGMLLSELYRLVQHRHVNKMRPKTQLSWHASIVKRIAPHFFHRAIGDITTEDVEHWMAKLAGEYVEVKNRDGRTYQKRLHGDRSINIARTHLVTIFNKGKKWGYSGDRNVAEHADRFREDTKQPNIYEPAWVQSIASGALERRIEFIGKPGHDSEQMLRWRGARDMTMIMLLAFTGMRIGELLALKWWDHAGGHLVLKHSMQEDLKLGPIKTGKQRSVPLIPTVERALEWWKACAKHTGRNDFVFSGMNDQRSIPIAVATWRRDSFIPAAAYAGFAEARPHDMRHTFVSLLAREGFSAKQIGDIVGDTAETVARVYTHIFELVKPAHLTTLEDGLWTPR